MEKDIRQEALRQLLDLAAAKGFVAFDDIFEIANKYKLSIGEFDWLSSNLTMRNIIIYESLPEVSDADASDDDFDDYAQTDYEQLFDNIIAAEPNLESLINDIRNIKPPQWKETNLLKHQVKEGNLYARQRMIEMHMRQAVRIAWQRARDYDADLEQTIGDAFVGLITAVDKYDPYHAGAFASYASMWIRQTIGREQLARNHQVYYPVHRRDMYFSVYPRLKNDGCIRCPKLSRCARAVRKIMEQTGCKVGPAFVVLKMCIPGESYEELYENADVLMNRSASIYKDFPILAYDGENKLIDEVNQILMQERIWDALDTLTPREEKVLRLRYGFDDGNQLTLEEVGKKFKLTRERIRQIEAKAIKKLRHPSRSARLKDYVEEKGQKHEKKEKKKTGNENDEILALCLPEGVSLTGIQHGYMMAVIELFKQKEIVSISDVATYLSRSLDTVKIALMKLSSKGIFSVHSNGIIRMNNAGIFDKLRNAKSIGNTIEELKRSDEEIRLDCKEQSYAKQIVNELMSPEPEMNGITENEIDDYSELTKELSDDKGTIPEFQNIEELLSFLNKQGLKTKDNRGKDGCVWIESNPFVDSLVETLWFEGRRFRFAESSKALGGLSGWYY